MNELIIFTILRQTMRMKWQGKLKELYVEHLTGKDQLEEKVAEKLGVRLDIKKPGRPKKFFERKKIDVPDFRFSVAFLDTVYYISVYHNSI